MTHRETAIGWLIDARRRRSFHCRIVDFMGGGHPLTWRPHK
jgi:hypothetical protein